MINGDDAQAQGVGRYASVNGLNMYYEIHGTGRPLVLLHGAFSAIGTSFGNVLPELAKTRQVIAFEMQAHGHTADIDRPLSMEQMADDTAAALQQLGIENADIFGYSLGAGIALQVALRHPEVVRKLVLASVTYNKSGLHPGLMEGLENMRPEDMAGSPWYEEYTRIAPNPEDSSTRPCRMPSELREVGNDAHPRHRTDVADRPEKARSSTPTLGPPAASRTILLPRTRSSRQAAIRAGRRARSRRRPRQSPLSRTGGRRHKGPSR